MNRIKSWIRSFSPYKAYKIAKSEWEKQYRQGHWDYLSSSEQLSRFSIIAGIKHHYFGEGGTILELGCGDNTLQKMIFHFKYKLYIGVDISETIIQKASETEDKNTRFICKDLEVYEPEINFDLIVFNESLYYIENPKELLLRYSKFLNQNGIIVISMWNSKERNNKIWNIIRSDFFTIDEIVITANKKKSWIIKTIRPK